MIVWVTEAMPLGGYQVWLEFNDGVRGAIDLGDCLYGPVFEPLKEPSYFERLVLHPELGTIGWPNGADLAPEFLYQRVQEGTVKEAEPRP